MLSDEPRLETNLAAFTLCGDARGGKGTTTEAMNAHFRALGLSVRVIEQGRKFRALTHLAIAKGIEFTAPDVESFITSPATEADLLDYLTTLDQLDDDGRKAILERAEVGSVVHLIGREPASHDLVIRSLMQQAYAARAEEVDLVLMDGRALEQYADKLEQEGVINYLLGMYFECNPLIAARRSRKIFGAVDTLSPEEQHILLKETENLNERNHDDAIRIRDPSRRPVGAYPFEFHDYHTGSMEERARLIEEACGAKYVLLDTAKTNDIQEMTQPCIHMGRRALQLLNQRDGSMGQAIGLAEVVAGAELP